MMRRHQHIPGNGVEIGAEVSHDGDDAAERLPRVGASVEQQPPPDSRGRGPVPRRRRRRARRGLGRAPAPVPEVENVCIVEEDALRGAAAKDERRAPAAAGAAPSRPRFRFRFRRRRHQRRAVREPRPRGRAAPGRVPRPPPAPGPEVQEPRVVERAAVARGAAEKDDAVGAAAGPRERGVAVPRARGALRGVRGDVELDPSVAGVRRVEGREGGRGGGRRRARSAVASSSPSSSCSPLPAAAAACAPFARRRVHGPRPEQPHLARDLLAGAAEEQ